MILELQPILAVGSISYATFKYLWKVFAERQRKLKSTPHYSFNVYVKKQKKDEKHLRLKVKVDLPGFDFDFFNIAICGLPNTGKTALVNSLRRLKDGDNGAAPEERTTEPGRYTDDGMQDLCYWDLPAIDEISPSKEYFEKYHLYAFDYVLFLKSCRPHQGEDTVFKSLQEFQQSVMLVVSKADELLRQGGGKKDVLLEVTQALKSDRYKGFESCLVSKWGFEGLKAGQEVKYIPLDEDKLQADILSKIQAATWLSA